MLRIGIDYRPALLVRSGIGRYVSNLVRHLPEVDEEIQLQLFSVFWAEHADRIAAARLPDSDRVQLAAARFPGRILNFLGKFTPLSVETFSSEIDVFHFTDYVYPPVKTKNCVCTLFDTSYLRDPAFHPPKNAKQLAAVASALVARAKIVLTISETTKADIVETYKIPEERIVVTPLGVDEIFLEEEHARDDQAVPYVLVLGTIEPRKNVPRTLRAFERVLERGVEAKLILAGRKGWLYDEVFELLERPALKKNAVYLGEVTDTQLTALLFGATCLAYPSLWEGFGLPVLEGMATGIPVLTSRRGALLEVAGDAAHLVDPESEDEIAAGLEKLLTDREYRAQIAALGRERARRYSWAECARKTVAAYRRAAE